MENIVVYGIGNYGQIFIDMLNKNNISINVCVVSDDVDVVPLIPYHTIPYSKLKKILDIMNA